LHSLAQKELEVSDILTPVLDLAQPVELKLFKSIEHILHTSQQFEAALSAVEIETHCWLDCKDPGESLKRQFLQAIDSARLDCITSLGHNFHATAAYLLANDKLTTEDIAACVNSENPPLAYARNKESYWDQVYKVLNERKGRLTAALFEALHSTSYKPLKQLGNWAAHQLSTLLDFCALYAGNCILLQPRAHVSEDAWQY
jgi:hypothetical protein